MNAEQAWQSVLAQLQMEMPRASFDTWVRDTRPIAYDNGVITVGVRNAYARDWLESRLASSVSRLLIGILNSNVAVDFVVSQADEIDSHADAESVPASIEITSPEPKPRHVTLNPRYTFDTYVVGSGNRLAHAACQAVAEKPARAYNPLFLYGGVGLGKTHLLHATGNACHASGLNVLYVSSEEFTNDMINAIRTHTTQAFRDKYRSADVLLVDDIQFIAGKESTQEEFFHTFNTLHGQDKQIIVSSDRPPKSLVTLEERLRSRFEWGLSADIQAPDFETRLAILRSKAERTGRQIADEVLENIAKRVQSNIRELEGALISLIAQSSLNKKAITLDLAKQMIDKFVKNTAREVSIDYIQKVVCDYFDLPIELLKSKTRKREIVQARQIAMYFAKKMTKSSLASIGAHCGGKDHATVLHACRTVNNLQETDKHFRTYLEDLEKKLSIA